MVKKKNSLLSIAVALALTACGGSDGGGGSPSVPAVVSTAAGKAVDGYLNNATAVCDMNKNGVADDGETVAVTDINGGFTFSPPCTSTILVSGGTDVDTNLPFLGSLQAPIGSSVVTTITSLLAAGMSIPQATQFLGLPANISLTTLDPVAKSPNGTLLNLALRQRTLAVQQIMQQITNTMGALAQNSTAPALQALYTETVKGMVMTALANPKTSLISTDGSISGSLVTNIVEQSVTNVATSANPTLSIIKTTISTYSGPSLAAVIAAGITAEAQSLATSDGSLALVKLLQSDLRLANAASQVSALLTVALAGRVDMSALGLTLAHLLTAVITNNTAAILAAQLAAITAVTAQSVIVNIEVIFDPSTLNKPTNYFSILNDQVTFNDTPYTLHEFMGGMTLQSVFNSLIDKVGFTLVANGTPIPRNANGAHTTTVSMGLEFKGTGTSGRVLQIIVDKVTMAIDANKKISVVVQQGAKAYVYSKNRSNLTANLTITNLAENVLSVDANNHLVFDIGNLFNSMIPSKIQNPSTPESAIFKNFQDTTGTFIVKFVLSTLDFRTQDGFPAPSFSLQVTGSNQLPIRGSGEQGIITVQ